VNTVKELFVAENRLEAVRAEADALPSFEITKVITSFLLTDTLAVLANPC